MECLSGYENLGDPKMSLQEKYCKFLIPAGFSAKNEHLSGAEPEEGITPNKSNQDLGRVSVVLSVKKPLEGEL